MLADARLPALLASAPLALVLADAQPPALLALAPLAVVWARCPLPCTPCIGSVGGRVGQMPAPPHSLSPLAVVWAAAARLLVCLPRSRSRGVHAPQALAGARGLRSGRGALPRRSAGRCSVKLIFRLISPPLFLIVDFETAGRCWQPVRANFCAVAHARKPAPASAKLEAGRGARREARGARRTVNKFQRVPAVGNASSRFRVDAVARQFLSEAAEH